MQKALNYADSQVRSRFGFVHPDLLKLSLVTCHLISQLQWLFVCSAICTLTQTFKLLWDRGRFSPISSSFQYFLPSFFCHDGEDFLLKGLPVQSIRINWYLFFIHHLNSTSVLLSPPSTLDNFMVLGFVICARFLFFFGYTCARSSEPRYKLGIVIGKLVTYLVLILQPNFINGIAVTILFLPGSTRIHVSYAQASSMIVLLRIMDTYLISESTHDILISLQGQWWCLFISFAGEGKKELKRFTTKKSRLNGGVPSPTIEISILYHHTSPPVCGNVPHLLDGGLKF